MATVASLLEDIRHSHPDITDQVAIKWLNKIHEHILNSIPLVVETVNLTALVAGTREYALVDAARRVWRVRYRASVAADDYQTLTATSWDQLNDTLLDWEKVDGRPTAFYLRAGSIGLYPNPDTASSGGFPRLEIDTTNYVALVIGGDILDLPIRYDAWTDYVKWKYAEDTNDPRWQIFLASHNRSMAELKTFYFGRNVQAPPMMVPFSGAGRIRRV